MKRLQKNKGFTLIELMVAMTISTIVTAAIYSTYKAQLSSYVTQQTVVEMQQNARAAIFAMERRIKHAGFNPMGSSAPHDAIIGIVANFADIDTNIGSSHHQTDIITDATHIAFTMDADEDGVIDNNDNELVAYRLNGENLEIYMQDAAGAWGWLPLAENIEALDFVYLRDDGVVVTPPADIDQVRSVQITLIAKSGGGTKPPALMMRHTDSKAYTNQQGVEVLPAPNDNFRRIALSANVLCRNLSL